MRTALFVLVLGISGCALSTDDESESLGHAEQGKIIGTNDLVPVLEDGGNIPEKYAPLLDAFGKLSNGCSVTHIGNGLVITAGHCVNAPSTRKNNMPCASYSIAWGYRKDKPAYLDSKCQVVLAGEYNHDRDYAIMAVRPIPPVTVEIDYAARPAMDQSITIFGHPQGRPLEWSKTCSVQPSSNGNWGSDQFSHQCDTEPGNSGSSVLDDVSLKVIGIHDGGRVPWNYATYLTNTPVAEFVDGYNVPPAVTFKSPTSSTVNGVITITVEASDLEDTSVAKVSFKLPDGTTAEATEAPYTLTFDTTLVANGSHKIEASASDSTGAVTTVTKSIRVNNASPPSP